VNAVIESVTAIANGAVGGAAKAIENAMSKALPAIVGFMASLLGLGGITGKIQDIIKRVRGPIDKAIDWVISQAVKFAKKIGNKLGFGKDKKSNKDGKPDDRTMEQKEADVKQGVAEADQLLQDERMPSQQVKKHLPAIKAKYKMTSLELVIDKETDAEETVHIEGKINPQGKGPERKKTINSLPDGPPQLPSYKNIFHHGTDSKTAMDLKTANIQAVGGNDFGKGFYTHTKENWHLAQEWSKGKNKETGWGVVTFPIPDELWEKEVKKVLFFQHDKAQPENIPENPETTARFQNWEEFVAYNKQYKRDNREELPEWKDFQIIRGPLWSKKGANYKVHQVLFTSLGVKILNDAKDLRIVTK
jgi:hypothetical protein